MHTTQEWWMKTKQDLIPWLKNQYHGELGAVERLNSFLEKYGKQADQHEINIVEEIIRQEAEHAVWIGELLSARGEKPQILEKEERYWNEVLPEVDSFHKGCAVAAHAEKMRLERIKVISEDDSAPEDIREVFKKIYKQEKFHASAFLKMSGNALDSTAKAHAEGLEALGLIL